MNQLPTNPMEPASIFSDLAGDHLSLIYERLDSESRANVRAACIEGRQFVYGAATQLTYQTCAPHVPHAISLRQASFLSRLPNLRRIKVRGFIGYHPRQPLAELTHFAAMTTPPLGRCSIVEHLEVGCMMEDLLSVSSFTGLRSLSCTRADRIPTCAPLIACTSLTELDMLSLYTEPAHESVGTLAHLKHLLLSPVFPTTFLALRQLTNLESLTLYTAIPHVYSIAMAASVFSLSRLTSLQLNGLKYPAASDSAADVALTLTQLASMRHLRSLMLGGLFVVDTIALSAIASLQGLTNLGVGGFSLGIKPRTSHDVGGLLPALCILKLWKLPRPTDMLAALVHFAPLNQLKVRNVTFKSWRVDRESSELAALDAIATLLVEAPNLALREVCTYGRRLCSDQIRSRLAALFVRFEGMELLQFDDFGCPSDDESYE